MADFNLSVVDNVITLDSRPDVVTSGSVNIYKAEFAFDDSWNAYTCLACFACGPELREAVITDGKCIVPWEVLRANGYLRIGVYGINGELRRPTIWTRESVYITPGAEPGEESNPPSPTIFEQMVQATADNRQAAEEAAARAVNAAVNPPKLSETQTWLVWDPEANRYDDTGIYSGGEAPNIDPVTHNWVIGGVDTGITAEGKSFNGTFKIGEDGHLYLIETD